MLIVLAVHPKEWVVYHMEPRIGEQEDQCLPHPRASLHVLSNKQPELLDGGFAVHVGNNLCLSDCIMKSLTEGWLGCLRVGDSLEPLGCVLLDVVIEDAPVDH